MATATHIKICGIDTIATAETTMELGVDAIGLVFAPDSARRLAVDQAATIARVVAGQTQRVGMFVNPSAAEVKRTMDAVTLDVLQFHGDETAAFCTQFGLPYFKALRAGAGAPALLADDHPAAVGWLLDTASDGAFGGTGKAFDWHLWPSATQRQNGRPGAWILAGGLEASNVGDAISMLRPDMVDVSSGVEGPQKGRKDQARIEAFVAAVRAADAQLAHSDAHSHAANPNPTNLARNP